MAKKIKVRILPKVSNFSIGGRTYLPGQEVEIPRHHFRADFMEKAEAPVKAAKKAEKKEEPPAPPIEPPETTASSGEEGAELTSAGGS